MNLLITPSPGGRFTSVAACFWAYGMFLCVSLPFALAGPENPQVVNGDVSIQQSGYNTTITASDKAIINYSSFDIARPETVQFIQPDSSASVLNRILSATPTTIDGTLLANGCVFFVNPAGVYFGEGAQVNVNQLVASALNISDSDFMNGRYDFASGDGAVVNSGNISAEKVFLIGQEVTNSGSINCPGGYVVMAAGDRVFLAEPGSDVVVEVGGPDHSEPMGATDSTSAVLNKETDDADGGIRALTGAGDLYSHAISNVGTLSVSAETGSAGRIVLAGSGEVTNTGTIEATGGAGGQVTMEGARVGQFGTVHADGTVGNGGDVDLTASDVVALSSDSLTTANAGANGDGGKVIAYSPDTALFRTGALIEAKGGSASGDGGFIEVSGKNHVEIFGRADASATNGSAGTFLIDPTDITIAAAPAVEDVTDDGDGTFTCNADDNIILNTTIEGYLEGGTSVVLDTSDGDGSGGGVGGAYEGDGDIIQNADAQISKTSGGNATLTLTAERDINLDGGIVSSFNALDVVLNATGDVAVNAAITTNGGNVSSFGVNFDNTGGAITTAGGDVDIQNTGNVTIGAAINAGAGDVDIDGGTGVATSIGGGGTITSSGTITFEASGSIGVIATPIDTAGTGAISAASTGGDIYIDNAGDVTDLRLNADSGTIAFTNSGSIDTGAAISANAISLTSSGTMILDEAVTADSGAVTLSGALVDIDQNVGATGNIDLAASGNLDLDADITSSGGDVDIDVTGTVDVAANQRIIAGGDGTALTIDGAGITLNAGGTGTETVTNTGDGTITITDSGDTSLDNHSISIDSGLLIIDSANIYAASGNPQDEIDADGDISLIGANIGGADVIDVAGDASGDSTLTIESNGGGVGLRVNDDQFDAVDITIAGVAANNFNIDWTGPHEIVMQTDGAALTITNIDTSNFAPNVTITQSAGDVTITSVNTGDGNFHLRALSGSIEVDTISTTDAADVTLDSSAVITSADTDDDDVDITTGDFKVIAATGVGASGSSLDIDATTSNITASGDVFFDVVGADGHATTIDLSSGNVEIDGRNTAADGGYEAITLTSVNTNDGTVTVYNYDNALTATSVTAGGSNNIQLTTTSAGDVLLGAVDATGDQVTVTSAAAIEDDGADDGTAEVVATTVELNAATGIGASGSFDVTGTSISAGTTDGAIDLDSLATAVVTATSLTTGTGSIQFDQTGGQTLGVDLATTIDGAIMLTNDGAALTATSVTAGGNNNIQLTTTTAGDVLLGAVDATGDQVTVTSAASIEHDGTDDATAEIVATTIELNAATGMGATGSFDMTGTSISADTTNGAIDLDSLATAGVTATSLTTGTGTIQFDQTGGQTLGVDLATTIDGAIMLTNDDAALTATSVTAGGNNNIQLTTTTAGDVLLGAVDATGDQVTVTSAASIEHDGTDDGTAEIVATTIDLNAATGIGAGDSFDVTGMSVSADTTDGAIDLDSLATAGVNATSLTTGTGSIQFDQTGGQTLTVDLATTADGSITLANDDAVLTATSVTAGGNNNIQLTTTTAGDIDVGSLTAGNAISLEATNGAITQSGGIITLNGGGSLTMVQSDPLDTKDFTFANQGSTDLTLQSSNGSVTSDNAQVVNAADKWRSITATARDNIELEGSGNINIASAGLSSALGGVKVVSTNGTISTPDADGALNAPITGYSDHNADAGVWGDLHFGSQFRAAIFISSQEALVLGPQATLRAHGTYYADVDDRPGVGFLTFGDGAGDLIDVAIYLGSPSTSELFNVDVRSKVDFIADYGGMVIDGGDAVTFKGEGSVFLTSSAFDMTNRLEVVSRSSITKEELVFGRPADQPKLPYAQNPEDIRTDWPLFAGAYVLRGELGVVGNARQLDWTESVPLALPRPLELEESGDVEGGPDVESLIELLSELGIGVQPYLADAYAGSLSTDLRLLRAAERLQGLIAMLEDVDGTRTAALRAVVGSSFPTLDSISEEQVDSFRQELARHAGDGTDHDLAGRTLSALTTYVDILSTDVGWPKDRSVGFVMARYVPRLTEGDDIRTAVVQMQLEQASGT